jgi:hypothetical protein
MYSNIGSAGPCSCAVCDLGRLDSGIVGSNPARGVDVCLYDSVLYCPV